MKKLLLLAAGAAGYVLGSRAGRERYEQIQNQATKVWNNPKVQQGVDQATEAAKTGASAAQSKASDAGAKVASKGKRDDGADTTSTTSPPLTAADLSTDTPTLR